MPNLRLTANASLYKSSGNYQTGVLSTGMNGETVALALQYATVAPGRFSGPGTVLGGFGPLQAIYCGSGFCSCTGEEDCNTIFDRGLCGPIAVCTGSGDNTTCICTRA
jgi:hypothetical protein